ncbi:hypothetical protein RAA17_15170 [Komagataeibacter rhaeticus]|nr:hypothetical protein [Komagataeibacter rhaeticus]
MHGLGNGIKAILESGLDPGDLLADEKATARTVEECLRFDTPCSFYPLRAGRSGHCGHPACAGKRSGCCWAPVAMTPPLHPGLTISCRGRQRATWLLAGHPFLPGAPLARLEMQVALALLFRRCPTLRLAAPPVYANSFHFRGWNHSWSTGHDRSAPAFPSTS